MREANEWLEENIGENLALLSGFPFPSNKFSNEEGFPLIRIRDVVESSVETYYQGAVPPMFIVKRGDVLVGMDGDFNLAKWNNRDALLNQRVLKVDVLDAEKLDINFVFYWLHSYIKKVNDITAATTVKHLSTRDIRKAKARIPSLRVQKRIGLILQTIEKAEALIEKYQQIKAGLVHDLFTRGIDADGKLRPPREQAPELYQQTPLGWIPKDWEVKGLKDVYKNPIRDFGSFSSTSLITFLEEGVPFIKSEMVKEEEIDWTSVSFISTSVHRLLSKSHVQEGQILFSKIGSALGKAVLYDGERGECNSNAAVAKIEVNESIIEPQFAEIFLNSNFARRQFELMIISLLPRINLGDINKVLVPLPKIAEQELICTRYNSIRAKLRSEKSTLAKLQCRKSGLLHDLLTGRVQVSAEQPEAALV